MKTTAALAVACTFCLAVALGCAAAVKPVPDSLEDAYPQWKEAAGLTASAAAGRGIFFGKEFAGRMVCANCHGFEVGDSLMAEADGLVRAGASLWGASRRTNIKGKGGHVAALGGNHCVEHWQGGPAGGLTAQELADLDAFLKTGGDATHDTANNLDYAAMTFTLPQDLTGGDAARGGLLVVKFCVVCHDVENKPKKFGSVKPVLKPASRPADRLLRLARRIKDSDYVEGGRSNRFMPGFSDQRMNEQELKDILAWFEQK